MRLASLKRPRSVLAALEHAGGGVGSTGTGCMINTVHRLASFRMPIGGRPGRCDERALERRKMCRILVSRETA